MKKRKFMKTKHGMKYLLVTVSGMFGPEVFYFDSIKDIKPSYRDMVKRREAAVWRAHGDKIYSVGLSGRLPEDVLKAASLIDSSDPRLA